MDASGGASGPAIELAACRLTGAIDVGGYAGRPSLRAGGRGGAILLEAPSMTVHSTLAADLAGGAVFNAGAPGQAGQPGDTRALRSEPAAE